MNVPKANVTTDAPVLLRERDNDVAILVLNRPLTRNSLTEEMLTALSAALTDVAADRTVRTVVIAANGPAFCAWSRPQGTHQPSPRCRWRARLLSLHHDDVQRDDAADREPAAAGRCSRTGYGDRGRMPACGELRPGRCFGERKICDSGVDIGLFCSTPMVALSRNVTRKHAMEMLLTGDAASAEDAYRMGLVNRVVPAGKEREEALAFAHKIASKSSHTVKIGKEGFYRQAEMSLSRAYEYVSEVMVENLMARDAEEGPESLHRQTRT
jgi:enoyl-CoA hydratase/carnithine racemase